MNNIMTIQKSVTILIPCFNEQESINLLFTDLASVCSTLPIIQWNLLFVNDGSTDQTLPLLKSLIDRDHSWCHLTVINLTRNFGKEAALIAGLDYVTSDACIVMDADLQHPPSAIPEMLRLWSQGADVVSAKRELVSKSNSLKRLISVAFYRIFRATSKLEITLDSSDFRLLDKAVVLAIRQCRESVRFSKGFFAWVGFSNAVFFYNQPERLFGTAKWGSWKLWNYALDGIFNFSTAPLRIWTYIGIVVTLISFSLGISVVLSALLYGIDLPGYTSIFVTMTFLGGIQLIGIGVLGEYIGRTYIESKSRPLYLIRDIYSHEINQ